MAAFALSELLPNKWRHIGVVIADSTTLMAVILAPVAARYGYETGGWKWNFWAAAIAQFASFLGLLFLYYLQHIRQCLLSLPQAVKCSLTSTDMVYRSSRWSRRSITSVRPLFRLLCLPPWYMY